MWLSDTESDCCASEAEDTDDTEESDASSDTGSDALSDFDDARSIPSILVPNEIILQVFKLLCRRFSPPSSNLPETCRRRDREVFNFGAVCKRWRQVSMESAIIEARGETDIKDLVELLRPRLEVGLQRFCCWDLDLPPKASKTEHPLCTVLRLSQKKLTFASISLDRVRRFRSNATLCTVFSTLQDATRLETLQFDFGHSSDYNSGREKRMASVAAISSTATVDGLYNMISQCKCLRQISVYNLFPFPGDPMRQLSSSWHNITHLRMYGPSQVARFCFDLLAAGTITHFTYKHKKPDYSEATDLSRNALLDLRQAICSHAHRFIRFKFSFEYLYGPQPEEYLDPVIPHLTACQNLTVSARNVSSITSLPSVQHLRVLDIAASDLLYEPIEEVGKHLVKNVETLKAVQLTNEGTNNLYCTPEYEALMDLIESGEGKGIKIFLDQPNVEDFY